MRCKNSAISLLQVPGELAVGQISLLSWYKDIFCFSCLSRRVAGMGWKSLLANLKSLLNEGSFYCEMWLTAQGRFCFCSKASFSLRISCCKFSIMNGSKQLSSFQSDQPITGLAQSWNKIKKLFFKIQNPRQ
jgi:hypothetical protein